jgi:predicted O-linked N-acetylglucosamine transferase (SPINDLY family)
LQLQPGFVDALNNLGNLLQEARRYDEALTCYRRLASEDGEALIQAYHCANHLCDWSQRADDEAAIRALLAKGNASIWPFGLLSLDAPDSALLQRQAGRQTAEQQFSKLLAQPPMVAPAARPVRDRLRIGYLSADFHDHATMHLLGGVLAAHDRARFAIHLYSYGPAAQDSGRQQAMAAAEVFRDFAALTDITAAEQIVADEIDILVDLKGYTQDSRLGITALRPAPLIVSWLGYPGTLGHERLADVIIGDAIVTPPDHADRYSETIVRMPHCYQPNDRTRRIGDRPTRAEAGLPEDAVVFCSFNQSFKITPAVFDLWCRVLAGVSGSVLWLLTPPAATIANLQREATARGIEPARLIFAERRAPTEHLARLQLADLALDTAPYGSHTTGSDALWAGVPLLTMLGETFASRVAASLLHAVGLPELI